MTRVELRLAKILGRRALAAFGVVTLLVAGLLAAINLASRYALKLYVEDQLSRLAWDVALYQTSEFSLSAEVSNRLREVKDVERVESLTFLRTKPPPEALLEVDGKPLASPWVSLLAASDARLLPPEARPAVGGPDGAFLALVGPEQHMGRAFLALQGSKVFTIKVASSHRGGKNPARLFDLPIRGVVRLERSEMNRYFMDEIGSISFVPYIGVILVIPHDFEILRRFDALSRGALGDHGDIHVTAGEYLPEVVHLARVDRARLISGWDIEGSLERLERLHAAIDGEIKALSPTIFLDNAILVLVGRMAEIARLIGLATLLIAIPLLAIAWLLASNLSALLILNERRKLGLMRLRGVPGRLLGRSLLFSIGAGGLAGGLLGLALGSSLPLLFYERGRAGFSLLATVQRPSLMLLFLVVGLALALLISRRLVRYATTISPLEASRRVAVTEAAEVRVRFRAPQLLALLVGGYKIAGWIANFSIAPLLDPGEGAEGPAARVATAVGSVDRALDFLAIPLFVYGLVTLLASRERWLGAALAVVTNLTGGRLKSLALRHMSLKPHRVSSFLLIVALMASVSLYPGIGARSFEDKARRGGIVQVGSELHMSFNPTDFVSPEELERGLAAQVEALRGELRRRLRNLAPGAAGIAAIDYLFEALLPGFFFPGYGLSGVPLYLIENPGRYLKTAYYEEELGVDGKFSDVIRRIERETVVASRPVADFWNLGSGEPVLLGADLKKRPVLVPSGGVVGFLPGMPPRSITDRQSYVSARIDYLNYLSSTDAYLVAAMDNPKLAELKVLIPRVLLLVRLGPGADPAAAAEALSAALGARPLEVRELGRELGKVGRDMFIFLALENMRIYLAGGVVLALIAIVAIALTNYLEDRRTLGLLRVRGVSPPHLFGFLASSLLSPALIGLAIGAAVAAAAGYGLTNVIWSLRELKSVVHLLATRLVISGLTLWTAAGLLGAIVAIALVFSLWVFRRTARETVGEV